MENHASLRVAVDAHPTLPGRRKDGTALPGFTPNPAGNTGLRASYRLKQTVQRALERSNGEMSELESLVQTLIAAGHAGDIHAIRELLDRGYGKAAIADEDREALNPTGSGMDAIRAAIARVSAL